MSEPMFKKADQVIAAGMVGEVVDPDAGTAGGGQVRGQAMRLVGVRWQGEIDVVTIRESLLTLRRKK
ncbi:hypothetical protein KBX71_07720 [Micromonospora sp. D93]|uniref:hypothetical protein n=1 Tax=Micromonospora sp. D93 TaxID=2824886 RepID=UPI001B38016C|nr:hypothetical protein [Micromonospora sp. D93]MBQ1017757.1 hypothetical protein [Micromonospora sp. D93]